MSVHFRTEGKVLAAALCATTVATFYAAPVMAADLTAPNGNNKLTVNDNAITGVVDGKVLAAALCATTVATFYAAPVMAADLTAPNGNNKLTVNDNAITGVVDSDKKGSKNEFTINDQVTQFKTTVVQDSGRNKISSIRQNYEGVRLRAAEWTDGTATNGRFSDVLVTADSVKFGQGVNNPNITPNYTFTVDTKTGNLTAGTINGATINKDGINGAAIRGNSFNGAVILGQKFNGVNVQELKAQVDGLNGNVATTNKNVAGIERTYTEDVLGQRDYTTTIEGTLSANDKGVSVGKGKDGKEVFHVSAVSGNVTGGLYNGVDVKELQETTSKINEDTLGINRENGVTTIEGRVNVDKLGNVKAHLNDNVATTNKNVTGIERTYTEDVLGQRYYTTTIEGTLSANDKGVSVVNKDGKEVFHVSAVSGNVTGGRYNGVDVKELQETTSKINEDTLGINRENGVTTIEGRVNVDKLGNIKAHGNLTTEGTINGAAIRGNSFNGAVILGQKFNGVNVQELKAQVDGLNDKSTVQLLEVIALMVLLYLDKNSMASMYKN